MDMDNQIEKDSPKLSFFYFLVTILWFPVMYRERHVRVRITDTCPIYPRYIPILLDAQTQIP